VKTNAARILEGLGIAYELREYDVDPEDLSAGSVARKLGLLPERVFKTLVARGDRSGVCFAVVPGDRELDLRALCRLSGDRSAETVPLRELLPLTGYVRGGVTALGGRKAYPVFLDESALRFETISVSAGARGTQLLLAPADYVRAVGATVGPLSRAPTRP
jgi:Cys-tRNA(Pro)/Cys-tRNA(Cys) deacylase